MMETGQRNSAGGQSNGLGLTSCDTKRSFVADTLDRALVLAALPSQAASERAAAAAVAALLMRRVLPTEQLAADVMNIISRSLDAPSVVRPLSCALLGFAPDRARLVGPLSRLVTQAHAGGHFETLYSLSLLVLLDDDASCALQAMDAQAAFEWARGRHGVEASAGLLDAWVERHGPGADWVCHAVEATPELFSSRMLSLMRRCELHFVAPSVMSWRQFARVDARARMPPWEPRRFRDPRAAVCTLQQAIGEEPGERRRVVLARWMTEIAG
jgi:hypothetical protein